MAFARLPTSSVHIFSLPGVDSTTLGAQHEHLRRQGCFFQNRQLEKDVKNSTFQNRNTSVFL